MKIGETIVLIEDHRMLGWPYRRGQRFRIIGDGKVSDYEGALNCGIPAILKDKDLSIYESKMYQWFEISYQR